MTLEELRAIVREVVQTLTAEQAVGTGRRALVALTGARTGFDEALHQLELLVSDGWSLDMVQSAAARERLPQDVLRRAGLREVPPGGPTDHGLLVVAALSANTAAKLAHGIDDTPVTRVVTDFLLSGRPVVAAATAASPDSAARRAAYPDVPNAYRGMLLGNLQALQSFGVRLVDGSEIARAVDDARRAMTTWGGSGGPAPTTLDGTRMTCHERLVSHRVIQPIPRGTVLTIDAGAIVTALARDTARARQITVHREEEKRDVSRQGRGNGRLHTEG